jgi:2-aminoadipate transaminase
MISFERGNPCVESFPVEQIKQCAASILDNDPNTVLQYGKPMGYMPLRETIAAWHDASSEEVLVSNGSLQILEFLSTVLVEPGDTVFVDQPTYDRTVTIFRRHQANVIGVPVIENGPDTEWLKDQVQAARPKFFYVIPDFQNPTGVTASLAAREEIITLAEAHDFWIIEDAPYRHLRYKGAAVPTMKSLCPDRVIHMSSFTKIMSPGLRVGYAVAPSEIIDGVSPIVASTYISAGLLAQGITYEFCRRGLLEPNIQRINGIYAPRLDATIESLKQYLPQASWVEPEGGFFVGVTLAEDMNTEGLRDRARGVGVGLSDGRGFFPNEGGERFLRLAFPALPVGEIREGLSRVAELVAPVGS